MTDAKQRIFAIVGPTASGKTSLSIVLAKKTGGEVICCDSMQIYRGMDIGTAKPTIEEMQGVPHHLLDFVSPTKSYSCAEYVLDARAKIQEIAARGSLPVLCGGTGLYLDALLLGGSFEDTPSDPAIRERWQTVAEQEGGKDMLYERLLAVDPDSAAAIHKNNVKRVIRALEIFECCGIPKSVLDKQSRERGMLYDACVIGLRYHSRERLYARIDQRVDIMLRDGLYDEVVRLRGEGVFEQNTTAAQAIGYKELLSALDGQCTLDEAVNQLKMATRHYAKRQMTWFSAKPYVNWIYADDESGQMRESQEILDEALRILATGGGMP
jgi:tRNA dimethylallyltransferase